MKNKGVNNKQNHGQNKDITQNYSRWNIHKRDGGRRGRGRGQFDKINVQSYH